MNTTHWAVIRGTYATLFWKDLDYLATVVEEASSKVFGLHVCSKTICSAFCHVVLQSVKKQTIITSIISYNINRFFLSFILSQIICHPKMHLAYQHKSCCHQATTNCGMEKCKFCLKRRNCRKQCHTCKKNT